MNSFIHKIFSRNKDLKLLVDKCSAGDGTSCNDLGHMLYIGKGVKQNYPKAVEYLQKACDLDDGMGCNNVGHMYRYGKGVEKDEFKAFLCYEKACDLGYRLGCSNVAGMYREGDCVQRNDSKCREYYKKACESGPSDGYNDFITLLEADGLSIIKKSTDESKQEMRLWMLKKYGILT